MKISIRLKYLVTAVVMIVVGVGVFSLFEYSPGQLTIRMKTSKNGRAAVAFGSGQRYPFKVTASNEFKTYHVPIPKGKINPITFRPLNKHGEFSIYSLTFKGPGGTYVLKGKNLAQKILPLEHIKKQQQEDYFAGKNLSKRALLSPGDVPAVNRTPLTWRMGLAVLFMIAGFLVVWAIYWLYPKIIKIKYLGFVLLLTFGISGLVYVYLFGVNVPFYDEWAMVDLFDRFNAGTLAFSDFFGQHLEHRMFFPRIVILILGVLTKFNCIVEMVFIQFLMFIIMLVLFLKLKERFRFTLAKIPAWMLLIPMLLFSWRQYENFLWGLQISFVMPLTFALLSFYFIHRLDKTYETNTGKKYNRYFALAVICAVISSFSMAMGLFTWLAAIFQILLLSNKDLKKYVYLGIWTITGLLTWVIYFLGYVKPPNHPSVFYVLSYPVESFESFIMYLGSALFWSETWAYLAGAIILLLIVILAVIIIRKKQAAENSFWLTIILFCLFVGGSFIIGRAGFGSAALRWSRYTTYSIPIVISLYVLLNRFFYQPKKHNLIRILHIVILILITAGTIVSYKEGYNTGKELKAKRQTQALHVLTIETRPDKSLNGIYPSIPHLRIYAKKLKKLGYNVYNK